MNHPTNTWRMKVNIMPFNNIQSESATASRRKIDRARFGPGRESRYFSDIFAV